MRTRERTGWRWCRWWVLCWVAWTTLPRNIKRVSPRRVPLYLVTLRSTYLQYLRVEVGARTSVEVDATALHADNAFWCIVQEDDGFLQLVYPASGSSSSLSLLRESFPTEKFPVRRSRVNWLINYFFFFFFEVVIERRNILRLLFVNPDLDKSVTLTIENKVIMNLFLFLKESKISSQYQSHFRRNIPHLLCLPKRIPTTKKREGEGISSLMIMNELIN